MPKVQQEAKDIIFVVAAARTNTHKICTQRRCFVACLVALHSHYPFRWERMLFSTVYLCLFSSRQSSRLYRPIMGYWNVDC